jgi:hypothetical protein
LITTSAINLPANSAFDIRLVRIADMAEVILPTRLQNIILIAYLILVWVNWVMIDKLITTVNALYHAFLWSALFLLGGTVLITFLNTVMPFNGVPDA